MTLQKLLALALAVCLVVAAQQAQAAGGRCYKSLSQDDFPHCQELSPLYALHWAVRNGTITLGIDAQAGNGWVGFGLSDAGSMKGADITVVSQSAGGTWQATDMHATGFERPLLDKQQDVMLLSAESFQGTTVAIFRRPTVSCDTAHDMAIENGMRQTVIWAIGQGQQLSYHGSNMRGQAEVTFQPSESAVSSTSVSATLPPVVASLLAESSTTLNVTIANFTVPPKETTFMCKYVKLPSDKKYHVVGFQGIVTSKYIHHVTLYRCSGQLPKVSARQLAGEPFECTESPCMENTLGWVPGMQPTVMPPEAGLPFGGDTESLFVLNVHYNNPDGVQGVVDSSGVSFKYTSVLRPHDMGVLTLGDFNVNIPPGRTNVTVGPNICSPSCTSRFPWPITLLLAQPHMHLLGEALQTQLIRRYNSSTGATESSRMQELQPIVNMRNYDFDFQKGTAVPPASTVLLPGDTIVTTCNYNSRGRIKATMFGKDGSDEMCYNFLLYYPRMPKISYCMGAKDYGITLCGHEKDARTLRDNLGDPLAILPALESGLVVEGPPEDLQYEPYQAPACLRSSEMLAGDAPKVILGPAAAAAAVAAVPATPPPGTATPSSSGGDVVLAGACLASVVVAMAVVAQLMLI